MIAIEKDNGLPFLPSLYLDTLLLLRCFFQSKSIDIFLISPRKHMFWYSFEAPRRGATNEYPQHMFSLRNKKTINLIPILIKAYALPAYHTHPKI